jgi:hypothetical protein
VFPKPQINELLRKYTLVQLYTDRVPPKFQGATTAAENVKFLYDRFKSAQLPTYVILKPLENGDFEEVSRYPEGKINHVEAFAEFLQQPLEAASARASSE